MKLTNVTGPGKPCNVGGEVRPPKVVGDVCMCGKVSVMSGGKNCWSFVTVNHYFMMTLQIPPPKVTIHLEEVFGVAQECIGESWRMFHQDKPFVNMAQMVVSSAGSIRSGEQVIGEWGFVRDGLGHGTISLSGLRICMNPYTWSTQSLKSGSSVGSPPSSAGCFGCWERPSGPCWVPGTWMRVKWNSRMETIQQLMLTDRARSGLMAYFECSAVVALRKSCSWPISSIIS